MFKLEKSASVEGINQFDYDECHGYQARDAQTLFQRLLGGLVSTWYQLTTLGGMKSIVNRRAPSTRWLPNYKLEYIVPDILAGATLCIYNIPQGMAYSVLAGLPPVYGLYASFWPPLFYAIFGSSRHSSIGVFSLTCLMIKHARTSILPDNMVGVEGYTYKGVGNLTPENITMTLAFAVGIFQLLMALIRSDIVMSYLSDAAVAGLTFGAAIQAFVAQLPTLLGISIKKEDRTFLKIFYNIVDIARNVPKANVATVICSAITIITLFAMKLTFDRHPIRVLGKYKFPFPTELIVLIVSTLSSHFLELNERWSVKIISHVPTGFPAPAIPRFDIIPLIWVDAISIAIVAYVVTISMGKTFAKKHRYVIDNNQEMLALGMVGVFSSFFWVFPTSTSLSRTLVNEASGAKTQMSGVVSSSLMALIIIWFGPLLQELPMCTLSAIVVVALRSLLMKIQEVPYLWMFSKMDVIVWVVTAVVTICYDIIEGLGAGIICAIFLVAIRSQRPTIQVLGEVAPGDYRVFERYQSAEKTKFTVIRFDAPLIFTNVDRFLDCVRSVVENISAEKERTDSISDYQKMTNWTAIVLDCGTWTYTDAMGIDAVKDVNEELQNRRILILFANMRTSLRRQYAAAGLFRQMARNQFYPSIKDALLSAESLSIDHNSFFKNEDNVRLFLEQ